MKKTNKKKVNLMWIVFRNYKVFIKIITKIALSATDDKGIKSVDSIDTRIWKLLVCKIEEIKCENLIKQY